MHGLLVTPRGSLIMQSEMARWLDKYYQQMLRQHNNPEPDCRADTWIGASAFAVNGHDLPVAHAIRARHLHAVHVWPQLIEQRSHVEASKPIARHRKFNYHYLLPPVCTACAEQYAGYFASDRAAARPRRLLSWRRRHR
jgi:hypothetical protein